MNRTSPVLAPPPTDQPGRLTRRAARLLLRGPATLTSPVARWAVTLLAVAGAALLAWSGVIHLQLWSDGYRDISVIGPLFSSRASRASPSPSPSPRSAGSRCWPRAR